jgi:hypothetical protein
MSTSMRREVNVRVDVVSQRNSKFIRSWAAESRLKELTALLCTGLCFDLDLMNERSTVVLLYGVTAL